METAWCGLAPRRSDLWGTVRWLTLALACLWPGPVEAQHFGRNKVNYDIFEWSYIKTKHFDIYFYESERRVAFVVAELAEDAYDQLRQDLHYRVSRRIPIILYISHNDFQQTNVIGSHISEETGGFTELFQNRVVIPFEGSYEKLRHVIHHELTHAVMFDMFFGGVFDALTGQQFLFQIPLWFAEGMAEYTSHLWDAEADMLIRDGVINGYLPPIHEVFGGSFAYKGGQAFFRHLAAIYGEDTIGALVTALRSTHDFGRSFKIIFGKPLEELSQRWHIALKKRYWPEIARREQLEDIATRLTDHRTTGNYINRNPTFSPNGEHIAFLSDRHEYKDILIMSAIDGEVVQRVVRGEREGDFEEMHWLRGGIAWAPDAGAVAFAAKSGRRDALHIRAVDERAENRKFVFDLDAIFSPAWSPDGRQIAFVGLHDGESDLYLVELKTGALRRITDDRFDEADPEWSPDGRRLAFASDRKPDLTDTTSALTGLDYDIYTIAADGSALGRITLWPSDERTPTWSPDGRHLAFSSDRNGIYNLYTTTAEGDSTSALTDVLSGALDPSWSPNGKGLAFVAFENGGWDIFVLKKPLAKGRSVEALMPTWAHGPGTETAEADTSLGGDSPPGADERSAAQRSPPRRRKPRRRPALSDTLADMNDRGEYIVHKYGVKFAADIVGAQAGYATFSGFNGQAALSVSDILGNHRLLVVTDVFYSLDNSDVMVGYTYLRRRTDYSVSAFLRRDFFVTRNLEWFADRTYGVTAAASRPFNKFSRLDFRLLFISIDRDFIRRKGDDPPLVRALLPSVSYVSDNVLYGATGPENGSRNLLSLRYSPDVMGSSNAFTSLEGDMRRYHRIGRFNTGVIRLAGGASFGSDPHRFFVGGTSAWISPRFAEDRDFDVGDVYFARLPVPLRGMDFYELVGTRFGLMNLEFRFPLVRYMAMGWPLPMVLRNIRGVLFTDLGAAWNRGRLDLFDTDNSGLPRLGKDARMGFGYGFRLNLGIAILRFDAAWRTDLRSTSQGPRYYISLGPDF